MEHRSSVCSHPAQFNNSLSNTDRIPLFSSSSRRFRITRNLRLSMSWKRTTQTTAPSFRQQEQTVPIQQTVGRSQSQSQSQRHRERQIRRAKTQVSSKRSRTSHSPRCLQHNCTAVANPGYLSTAHSSLSSQHPEEFFLHHAFFSLSSSLPHRKSKEDSRKRKETEK